ncbi:AFG1/ZapE family ATPase [Deinococcus yavapaiensis]|nr:AFG1/ZapE family ATPase [Deinococcus yavapaiensis]
MIDLLARRPTLTPTEMLEGFVPSARFRNVSFDNYLPNPAFPSQAEAKERLRTFATKSRSSGGFRLFRRSKPEGEGVYLDGGFGVGKTHLLAATWFAFDGAKAFLSFQELLYAMGALGMEEARRAFARFSLLAVDEFELDDPGNTHMVNTFLAGLMPSGTNVVTTSNTEPGALGQGRFNAEDFRRQITEIAHRFDALRVDGPDFRARGVKPAAPLDGDGYAAWRASKPFETLAEASHRDLNRHLLNVHPARFGKLLAGVDNVGLRDVEAMPDQNVALRFVHFVDKVYDLGVGLAVTGSDLSKIFPDTYRHGAYAKKYSRAFSRLTELLREART